MLLSLQISGVCYNITSPVTGKSTDLALKFGKIIRLSLFGIDKYYIKRFIHSNYP